MKATKRKRRITFTPGELVKELRQRTGWTQKELGEVVGMASTNISNIENGKTRLGEDRAILLAEALGVSPETLLFPNGYEREDLKDKLAEIRKRKKKWNLKK